MIKTIIEKIVLDTASGKVDATTATHALLELFKNTIVYLPENIQCRVCGCTEFEDVPEEQEESDQDEENENED